MGPTGKAPGASRQPIVALALVLFASYLLITAVDGYSVGRAIYEVKATNPLFVIVSREAIEQRAIAHARMPPQVTDSPTFWIALRLTE
ncbi:MAG: hypothetical protein ACYDDQ_02410 [Vulcanimicrobiaceae bacterium]